MARLFGKKEPKEIEYESPYTRPRGRPPKEELPEELPPLPLKEQEEGEKIVERVIDEKLINEKLNYLITRLEELISLVKEEIR